MFHRERTMKSSGLGFSSFDKAAFCTNETMRARMSGSPYLKCKKGLTRLIDARYEVEPVRRRILLHIDEITDCASWVVEPRPCTDAAFCR